MAIKSKAMGWLMVGAAALALAGCGTAPAGIDKPVAGFASGQVQPLVLSVGQVDVKIEQQPVVGQADSGHAFGSDVAVTLGNYARDRFRATGIGHTRFEFRVVEARVDYDREEASNSLTRMMKVDGTDRYTITTKVRLSSYDESGLEQIATDIVGKNMLGIPDHFTLAERDGAKQQMMEELLRDLDARARTILSSSFYLLPPGQ